MTWITTYAVTQFDAADEYAEPMPQVCGIPKNWTDISLGQWENRGDGWHNRKSARMFRDYRAGFLNISALHYVLTGMWYAKIHHLPTVRVESFALVSPRKTAPYLSCCNADVANNLALPERNLNPGKRWRRMSASFAYHTVP